jgi:hypothetical protein
VISKLLPSPGGTVQVAVLDPPEVDADTVVQVLVPMVNTGEVEAEELEPKFVPYRVNAVLPPSVVGTNDDIEVITGAVNENVEVLVENKLVTAVTLAENKVPTEAGTLQ